MDKTNEVMNPPVETAVTTTTYTDVAFAKESEKRHKSIKAELKKIDSSFEKIAFNLYWLYENKAYEQLGYKTISEFTSKEYGIAKATTYNFINVVDRFGERDENGSITGKIREEFREYQSSKLTALLDVSEDEQLEEFTADMSVRDIKKKIKELSAEDEPTAEDIAEDESEVIDVDAVEVNRQCIIEFSSLADYNKYLDGMNDLIEKNLKSKSFKDGKKKIEVCIVW